MRKHLCILVLCLLVIPLMAGTPWTTKRLTWNSMESKYPKMTIDSNDYVHVVWQDKTYTNWEIFYKKSTNGGATWTTKRLTWNADMYSGKSLCPDIAVDSNGHIYIVFFDVDSSDIFMKKSTDGGATWTTQQLTDNSVYSYNPQVAVDSNNHIFVTWNDEALGNNEVFMKKSTDGGATWDFKRLTWNSGGSGMADLAIDSNDSIHLAWADNSSGNNEICYKNSTDGGLTWTTQRLTWNSGSSICPTIAVDSSDLPYLVWMDVPTFNFELYFKKKN